MSGFTFSIKQENLERLEKQISESIDVLKESLVFALGADLVGLIRNRVAKGIGSNDAPMTSPAKKKRGAYSADYADYRESKGRNTSFRDLTFTGRMMNGITVEGPFTSGDQTFVSIVFAGGAEVQIKATANEAMSPFFGISPKDQKALDAALEAHIENFLKNEGSGKNGRKSGSRVK